MRATFDTNVLISAVFWKGNESKIIGLAEKRKVTLVLSKEIIKEFEGILQKKFSKIISEEETAKIVEKIISFCEIVEPGIKVFLVKEDPEDNKIIECAIAGNSDYIVSGDKHLLKIGQVKTIKITTAKQFLETILRR